MRSYNYLACNRMKWNCSWPQFHVWAFIKCAQLAKYFNRRKPYVRQQHYKCTNTKSNELDIFADPWQIQMSFVDTYHDNSLTVCIWNISLKLCPWLRIWFCIWSVLVKVAQITFSANWCCRMKYNCKTKFESVHMCIWVDMWYIVLCTMWCGYFK